MPEIVKIADSEELKRCVGEAIAERIPEIVVTTMMSIVKAMSSAQNNNLPGTEAQLIGIYDAAQMLGVSKSTFEIMLKSGEVPQPWKRGQGIRGKRLWRVSDINDFIAGQPNDTTEIRS